MQIVRKSLFRKLALYLVGFAILISIISYLLGSFSGDGLSVNIFVTILAIFVLLFLGLYYWNTIRPLRLIMMQIQNLLDGKPYRRIYTPRIDEIGLIAHFFNQVTASIGSVSSGLKDRERMMNELEVASQLQRDILPLKTPAIEGLQVVAKNKPATEVGGDSFNVFTLKNKTYIYIGDVTGHGAAGGLIMTMVNSLISVFADIYESPFDIMVNVNRHIKRHVKKAMFMTMVMLCWDHETRKMTYVGAGHERILLYHAESGECEAILSGGVALGMVPDNSKLIHEKELEFDDGDFIVLYSDGITEARNDDGELFGLERLEAAVREYTPQYSADGVNYHIAKDVSAFMGSHKQEDDMTLIVIKRDTKSGADEGASDTAWK